MAKNAPEIPYTNKRNFLSLQICKPCESIASLVRIYLAARTRKSSPSAPKMPSTITWRTIPAIIMRLPVSCKEAFLWPAAAAMPPPMAWMIRQVRSAGRKMRGYQAAGMRERAGLRARAVCLRVR